MPTVSYNVNQAASNLIRDINGWVPALGTPISMTYGYRATAPGVANGTFPYPSGTTIGGFSQFTTAEIAVAEAAFTHWHDLANITFTRNGTGYTDSADMLLGNYTGDASAVAAFDGYAHRSWTRTNGVYTRNAEVWIDGVGPPATVTPAPPWYLTQPTFPNGAWRLMAHEIGHAIGLSHPGDYNAAPNVTITYGTHAEYIEDSWQYSIMSYFSETNTGADFGRQRPLTPMMHDVAAIQLIYGVNYSTRSGDTIYGFNSNTGDQVYTFGSATSERVFCIWDGGGNDTIDASGYASASVINLYEGSFSNIGPKTLTGGVSTGQVMTGNISIAYGAVIENATGGSGNDALNGNGANNTLIGNAGNNTLTGGGGWDVASYAFNYSAVSLNHTAYAAATIVGSGVSDIIWGIEVAHFLDRNVALREAGRSDISGDGAGDIAWFNASTGSISYYETNPAGGYTWHNIGGVGAGYTPLTGDFNGDGRADIFWSNGTSCSVYLMQPSGSYTWRNYGGVAAGYTPLIGDFNGDGVSDVLWSNGTSISTYLTNPNGGYTWRNVGGVTSGYTPLVGDFNGDGTSDILFSNGSSISTYLINATTGAYTWRNVGSVSSGYAPLVGDFSGDGTSDIAWWSQSTGAISYYEIDAATGGYTWHNIGNVAGGYTPFVRDFNNDGKADIGWTNGASVSYYDITPSGGFTWQNIGGIGAGYNVVA